MEFSDATGTAEQEELLAGSAAATMLWAGFCLHFEVVIVVVAV
jgi:hypothetical protein